MKLNLATAVFLGLAAPAFAGQSVTLYSSPTCDCCQTYADYLTANGYTVTLIPDENFDTVARAAGMPEDGIDCHVAVIDGYTMSGFIPVQFIEKLTSERPDVSGITLPGMRMEAPDMTEEVQKSLEVFAFGPAGVTLFAVE